MSGSELLQKMELIDPVFVEAADEEPAAKSRPFLRWAAACLCLLLALVPLLSLLARAPSTPGEGDAAGDGPPHIVLDGRTYLISAHLAVSDTLPEGFSPAGTIDVTGGFKDCPYYVNPEKPEWVYIYHEVRTNGAVDENGALISVPPHEAYVRYVDERLRDKALVCFEGNWYVTMWNALSPEELGVTQAQYEEIEAEYGRRIEGEPPKGFVLAGTAAFSGTDTVPTGPLASNTEEAEVYFSPDEPAVLLVQTHWFTAIAEEQGETRHDGYNVYIRYNCPFKPEN